MSKRLSAKVRVGSGQSRRFDDIRVMSGLPLIATEPRTSRQVRFVPL